MFVGRYFLHHGLFDQKYAQMMPSSAVLFQKTLQFLFIFMVCGTFLRLFCGFKQKVLITLELSNSVFGFYPRTMVLRRISD